VERLNIELNLWNLLKILLPEKLCNVFAFTYNEENIIIMGGLRQFSNEKINDKDKNKKKGVPEYEIENNVYLYNQPKEIWYSLTALPSTSKVCNIVHNNKGRFSCFFLDKKEEFPR
jgi:N-acetylneuraminic acid mutarotase